MAKEFLRTLCAKYLCDELCHKKWGKRATPNSKERPPRAKAKSRGSPWWSSPTTLLSLSGCPFLFSASHWEVLSQGGSSMPPSLRTLGLELVHNGRDLRGVGLRPLPRIPTSFNLLTSPHPPPWPSFKVLWRGMGGQGRPI